MSKGDGEIGEVTGFEDCPLMTVLMTARREMSGWDVKENFHFSFTQKPE